MTPTTLVILVPEPGAFVGVSGIPAGAIVGLGNRLHVPVHQHHQAARKRCVGGGPRQGRVVGLAPPLTPSARTASSCDYEHEYDEEQGSRVKNSLFVRRRGTEHTE